MASLPSPAKLFAGVLHRSCREDNSRSLLYRAYHSESTLHMAKIEDLIAHIADERLRNAIIAEVRELKKNKKFGLVFEEHLPETVRLPALRIKQDELVAKRRESGNVLWRVKSIRKGVATLEPAVDSYPVLKNTSIEVPLNELVVVRHFGDPTVQIGVTERHIG
jgi:hypothetical protein